MYYQSVNVSDEKNVVINETNVYQSMHSTYPTNSSTVYIVDEKDYNHYKVLLFSFFWPIERVFPGNISQESRLDSNSDTSPRVKGTTLTKILDFGLKFRSKKGAILKQ